MQFLLKCTILGRSCRCPPTGWWRLVAAHVVRVARPVDADDGLRQREVALVLDLVGRRVVVVVAAVPVLAPPVEVLHAQVQALRSHLTT